MVYIWLYECIAYNVYRNEPRVLPDFAQQKAYDYILLIIVTVKCHFVGGARIKYLLYTRHIILLQIYEQRSYYNMRHT